MSGGQAWLAIVGLGVFHGINPAMGWLFAVALGLHRGSRRVVLWALVPLAAGHAAAIAALLLLFASLGAVVEIAVLRPLGGIVLIGWAVYHALYGHRHRPRFGLTAGAAGLFAWSFLMASAHGAGVMLIPAVIPLGVGAPDADGGASLSVALVAVAAHTGAMLLATGVVALIVYERVGVAFLRRGWLNLDALWTLALALAGALLLAPLGAR